MAEIQRASGQMPVAVPPQAAWITGPAACSLDISTFKSVCELIFLNQQTSDS
jgi:hypothetical protein